MIVPPHACCFYRRFPAAEAPHCTFALSVARAGPIVEPAAGIDSGISLAFLAGAAMSPAFALVRSETSMRKSPGGMDGRFPYLPTFGTRPASSSPHRADLAGSYTFLRR